MWNPGFESYVACVGRLYGYHRAFCLYSEYYRGSPRRRGLVLGLDRGGSCLGRLYGISVREADRVLSYLVDREMRGHKEDVYLLRWLPIDLSVRQNKLDSFQTHTSTLSSNKVWNSAVKTRKGIQLLYPLPMSVVAACFVVNRSHEHYAGRLPAIRIAKIISNARGVSGSNREYLFNTIERIDRCGFSSKSLNYLAELVKANSKKRSGS